MAVLAGRIPALYIAALGAWKNTSVFCPLFSAFGPEPIFQRLMRGDAKILVTTTMQYKRKIADLRDRLPELKTILIADTEEDLEENVLSLPRADGGVLPRVHHPTHRLRGYVPTCTSPAAPRACPKAPSMSTTRSSSTT